MPTAKLTITLPDDVWVCEVSTANPDAEFRVLAAYPSEDTGIALAEVSAPDLPDVLGQVDAADAVSRLDLHRVSEATALVEFETTEPLVLFSVREAGVPLELPVTVQDGEAIAEITASRDRLSAFTHQLETFGLSFDVDYVRELPTAGSALTDRQRDLLGTAVEAGYYDTPRGCSLTDLAEQVGVAKSTASETLHRAEEKVVKQYVEA